MKIKIHLSICKNYSKSKTGIDKLPENNNIIYTILLVYQAFSDH